MWTEIGRPSSSMRLREDGDVHLGRATLIRGRAQPVTDEVFEPVPSGLAPRHLVGGSSSGYSAAPYQRGGRRERGAFGAARRRLRSGSYALPKATSAVAAGRCGKQFNERSGTVLNRAQCPFDVIALVALWRLRYKLGLRDLPKMFLVRGMVLNHEAVREWEAKLTPVLAEDPRRRRRGRIDRSWHVDETYIRCGRALLLRLSRHRRHRRARGRAVRRAPRQGGGQDILPVCSSGDGHRVGPGHGRWPRQLPARDQNRGGQVRAPPHQPIQEQRTGTGPPRPQKAATTFRWHSCHIAAGTLASFAHARLWVRPIGRPVLSRPRRAQKPPPPSILRQRTCPRRPPQTAPPPPDRNGAGHPRSCIAARRLGSETTGYTCRRECWQNRR